LTTTLSNGTDTIAPDLVDGYESSRTARTLTHDVIGRADPDITLRPADTRKGQLRLVFGDEAAAAAAEISHAGTSVWTLTTSDLTTIGMRYVVAEGDVTRILDATRACWIVTVPFREVLP
jgi:hypothetical protein